MIVTEAVTITLKEKATATLQREAHSRGRLDLETRSGAFAPSVLGCRNRSMRPRRTSSRLALLNIGRIAAPEREREAREVVREEGNRTPGFPGNPDCEGAFRLRRGVSLLTPQVSTRRPSVSCLPAVCKAGVRVHARATRLRHQRRQQAATAHRLLEAGSRNSRAYLATRGTRCELPRCRDRTSRSRGRKT